MTARTNCGDVERLLLEGEDGALSPDGRALVEGHLRGCARCRDFAADRDAIRSELAAAPWPALPDELDRRTRRLVRSVGTEERAAALPAWLLVAVAVITIVTGLGLAAALADVTPETTWSDLSLRGLSAVFVIARNALTLLLAPVILRACRARRSASGNA